jgi:hypothetical protein
LGLGEFGRGCGFSGTIAAFLPPGSGPSGGVSAITGGLFILLCGRVSPLRSSTLIFGARRAATSQEAKKYDAQEQQRAQHQEPYKEAAPLRVVAPLRQIASGTTSTHKSTSFPFSLK